MARAQTIIWLLSHQILEHFLQNRVRYSLRLCLLSLLCCRGSLESNNSQSCEDYNKIYQVSNELFC